MPGDCIICTLLPLRWVVTGQMNQLATVIGRSESDHQDLAILTDDVISSWLA